MKSVIRKFFYRFKFVQWVVGTISIVSGRTKALGIVHLQSYVEENAIGPLQRDEAIALFGLVRTLRPKTIVEFGFFHGHSAFNFVCAMEQDAKIFSYDVSEDSQKRAETELHFERRLVFVKKDQTNFDPADIESRQIDFVFFDASHDLDLNITTFKKIQSSLAPRAIIAVHDTGVWNKDFFSEIHANFTFNSLNGRWITDTQYAHQPEERAFVNWIVRENQGFCAIHLHSLATLRHGLSLLQHSPKLVE